MKESNVDKKIMANRNLKDNDVKKKKKRLS